MFQLLNNRFMFLELENDEKIYVDEFVFLQLCIYRRHISLPGLKMCLIPNIPLIGENIIIFSNKTFNAHIGTIHIAASIYCYIYGTMKRTLAKFALSKPWQKCLTGVTFGHLS